MTEGETQDSLSSKGHPRVTMKIIVTGQDENKPIVSPLLVLVVSTQVI